MADRRRAALRHRGFGGTGAAYVERYAGVNNLQVAMGLSMTAATIGMTIGVAIPNLAPFASIRDPRASRP